MIFCAKIFYFVMGFSKLFLKYFLNIFLKSFILFLKSRKKPICLTSSHGCTDFGFTAATRCNGNSWDYSWTGRCEKCSIGGALRSFMSALRSVVVTQRFNGKAIYPVLSASRCSQRSRYVVLNALRFIVGTVCFTVNASLIFVDALRFAGRALIGISGWILVSALRTGGVRITLLDDWKIFACNVVIRFVLLLFFFFFPDI